jgi:hypothetical protein
MSSKLLKRLSNMIKFEKKQLLRPKKKLQRKPDKDLNILALLRPLLMESNL